MFPQNRHQWKTLLIALGVSKALAEQWADPFFEVVKVTSFNMGEVELDDYLSQILHESGHLTRMVENLNYTTPERIMEVWPRRFPTRESALPYVRNPQGLAEKVYGMRKDLGNTEPGDGWAHRGMGLPQITGKWNFTRVADIMGQDVSMMQYLLQQPRFILEASLAWWEDRIPDSVIDVPDRQRKLVQGGTLGVEETRRIARNARMSLETLSA